MSDDRKKKSKEEEDEKRQKVLDLMAPRVGEASKSLTERRKKMMEQIEEQTK